MYLYNYVTFFISELIFYALIVRSPYSYLNIYDTFFVSKSHYSCLNIQVTFFLPKSFFILFYTLVLISDSSYLDHFFILRLHSLYLILIIFLINFYFLIFLYFYFISSWTRVLHVVDIWVMLLSQSNILFNYCLHFLLLFFLYKLLVFSYSPWPYISNS